MLTQNWHIAEVMIGPSILMQIYMYNPTRSISIVPRAGFPIGTSDQGALAVMSTDRPTLKEYYACVLQTSVLDPCPTCTLLVDSYH